MSKNTLNSAQQLVKCLEHEGVEYIFGIPGEENIGIMDALLSSKIEFITTRHEQGAAFMADVYGRLTGRAGVCMSTLGPGATNLVTGVADANMDRAPIVAIAGQGATTRLHKESHQILDLVNLFDPITKYSVQILEPEIVPEVVRKAFKNAQAEKPGAAFIDFPENVADMEHEYIEPLKVQSPQHPVAPLGSAKRVLKALSEAKNPVIIAGNGVIRFDACDELLAFAEAANAPVATSFMAKGAIPSSHPLSIGTVGMKAHDLVAFGIEESDLVICIGLDMVEYTPSFWNPNADIRIISIDASPAEVDTHFIPDIGMVGDIKDSLSRLAKRANAHTDNTITDLHHSIKAELCAHADDTGFPVKPQKIICDLRAVMDPEDIVISDVGAHKMWMARMFQAERPNTCIISNGFASMGIALPGAIAAKLVHPDRNILAVAGDSGFMMNNQEIETALRLKLNITIIIFNDNKYGLIEWHQMREYGRSSHIDVTNPDFVKFAESFGAKGYYVKRAEDLQDVLKTAMNDGTVSIIDCPVDYSENMKLTARLKTLESPLEGKSK
ncbi:acetolactate synthase large subunit [Paramylibacter kogurei]|uniref:acetolactate synthase large subunit n=1 Tax=Paramylibacter kogurei TaxID=1889778 RepID=UPI001F0A58E3|nr:acetolactate synthase large subunit [Amylibacter kogurei]